MNLKVENGAVQETTVPTHRAELAEGQNLETEAASVAPRSAANTRLNILEDLESTESLSQQVAEPYECRGTPVGAQALQGPASEETGLLARSPKSQGIPSSMVAGADSQADAEGPDYPPETDVCGAGSAAVDISGLPVLPLSSTRERSRRDAPLLCHIVDCDVNLASQAEYYQRYRICREHLRSPALVVDGIAQRFCQQCGRFHNLDSFDGDKRNCRARLAQHNSRRRKVGTASNPVPHGHRRGSYTMFEDFDDEYEPIRHKMVQKSVELEKDPDYVCGNGVHTASDSMVGNRRPRDPLEALYRAATAPTQPPSLRSRQISNHSSLELADDQASKQNAMQTLLARYYSEPVMSSTGRAGGPVGGDLNSHFPPAFMTAIHDVEATLGRRVMQALLQEGGILPPNPQQQPQPFLGLQSHDLLKMLKRSGMPQQHSPLNFGGTIPIYGSTPVQQSFRAVSVGAGGYGTERQQVGGAGHTALDAWRHLAATVPRSGFPPVVQPGLTECGGAAQPQSMTLDQHPPAPPPPPPAAPTLENPFSQHRDALQKLAAAAVSLEHPCADGRKSPLPPASNASKIVSAAGDIPRVKSEAISGLNGSRTMGIEENGHDARGGIVQHTMPLQQQQAPSVTGVPVCSSQIEDLQKLLIRLQAQSQMGLNGQASSHPLAVPVPPMPMQQSQLQNPQLLYALLKNISTRSSVGAGP